MDDVRVAELRRQMTPVEVEFADKFLDGHTFWPGSREQGADSFFHPGATADCVTCNPIPTVQYEPGSKLEQLHGEYWAAKSEADAATKRLKTATDSLKTEITTATNGAPKAFLEGPGGRPLYMDYRESERLNTKKLRADVDPAILAPYLSVSGAWYLTEKKS
jgi:hypothetical protein